MATQECTTTAEDTVKVDPRHYKVEFENERVACCVSVWGRKIGEHSHQKPLLCPDRHQSQVHLPDGRMEDIEVNAGAVQHALPTCE